MEPIRVVVEGVAPDLKDKVISWLNSIRIKRYELELSGRSIVLIIFYTRHLQKIREHLGELRECYSVILPAMRQGRLWRRGIPEIITGPAFETENQKLEQSQGRHIPLSALPSELAEHARRHGRR